MSPQPLSRGSSSPSWEIREGDALERLREMPDESVQCCVTSPPYWGLRDYEVEGQLGLEPTFAEFLDRLMTILGEVQRVLRPDGTLWLNMGDSYATSGGARRMAQSGPGLVGTPQGPLRGAPVQRVGSRSTLRGNGHVGGGPKLQSLTVPQRVATEGVKPKDLMGQPWLVALAARDAGWWLRRDIIWHKPNALPESAKDRPSTAHEYVFLLSKGARYYYDDLAVRQPLQPKTLTTFGTVRQAHDAGGLVKAENWARDVPDRRPAVDENGEHIGASLRSVWSIASAPYPEAHFATFPPGLAEPCILAGSRPGDLVLDPFAGAGTTGLVALRYGRSFAGIELNPVYAEMARERIRGDAPLLNTPAEVAAA